MAWGRDSPACSDHVSRNCDEGANALGANRCSSDLDCFGVRICTPLGSCEESDYYAGGPPKPEADPNAEQVRRPSKSNIISQPGQISINNETNSTATVNISCESNFECPIKQKCGKKGFCVMEKRENMQHDDINADDKTQAEIENKMYFKDFPVLVIIGLAFIALVAIAISGSIAIMLRRKRKVPRNEKHQLFSNEEIHIMDDDINMEPPTPDFVVQFAAAKQAELL
jgi:hypothetical protein